ncbi:hypothetical protein FRC12_011247 [Ceratobasidium sp. 428]|nr:hypothetical protein FRC12_011247 [Ceratobasidium sp. 428]
MLNKITWRVVPQGSRLSRPFTLSSARWSVTPLRTLTDGEQVVFNKLNTRFQPSSLDVEDVSGGCGTFYAISITSREFNGLPMIKQHKLVTEELKKEISGFHGLQIKTKPE